MATFPTLSIKPDVSGWEEQIGYDPTIRSPYEAGYILTRPRFTRIINKWTVQYIGLPKADKETLQDFEKQVKVGSNAFDWANPADGNTYTVRFVKPINYKPRDNVNFWDVQFELEEV